MLAKIKNLI